VETTSQILLSDKLSALVPTDLLILLAGYTSVQHYFFNWSVRYKVCNLSIDQSNHGIPANMQQLTRSFRSSPFMTLKWRHARPVQNPSGPSGNRRRVVPLPCFELFMASFLESIRVFYLVKKEESFFPTVTRKNFERKDYFALRNAWVTERKPMQHALVINLQVNFFFHVIDLLKQLFVWNTSPYVQIETWLGISSNLIS